MNHLVPPPALNLSKPDASAPRCVTAVRPHLVGLQLAACFRRSPLPSPVAQFENSASRMTYTASLACPSLAP